jgi:nicotinamide-nucleotide amidase
MRSEIISVGAELMSGATVDTNSGWLSDRLGRLGSIVQRHTTVGDDAGAITAVMREAIERVDLVVVTGGLGPTSDDLTRDALSQLTGRPLIVDPDSLAAIERYFASMNRPMPPSNRVQAQCPENATPLMNRWGTAPGIQANMGKVALFALPGVPREMKVMFEHYVEPHVRARCGQSCMVTRVIRTFGAGESSIGEQIADLMKAGRNPAVGTTADEGVISIRIVARAESPAVADALVERDIEVICGRLGDVVYGTENDTLASVVGGMLLDRGATLSTAESCTGGWIGKLLTDVAGSSRYYLGGYVTYSDAQKAAALGVPPEVLAIHGAVSEPVVIALATGCRQATGSDYAIAVSGIAGPSGGSPEKAVGTVWFGLAGPRGTFALERRFSEGIGREAIRDRSAKLALNLLRHELIRSGGLRSTGVSREG